MRFSFLTQALAFSATAYAAAVPANLTPDQILAAIQGLAAKATALQNPVGLITAENALQLLAGGGPLPGVISGIQDLASNAQGLAVLLQTAQNIPAGNPANAIIAAYTQLATVQQQVLTTLNQRLALVQNAPAVVAPVSAALQNLQVAFSNLYNQLTARLSTPTTPTPISNPQNLLTSILTQVLSTVTGLLNGLNLNNLLGGLLGGIGGGAIPTLPVGGGNGLPTLPGLPFPSLQALALPINGLPIGNLPILGGLLGGGGAATNPVKGLLGGILA